MLHKKDMSSHVQLVMINREGGGTGVKNLKLQIKVWWETHFVECCVGYHAYIFEALSYSVLLCRKD